jgi:hypothetical protein
VLQTSHEISARCTDFFFLRLSHPLLPPISRIPPFLPYAGFGIGAFFSLMGSSFTIEDPFQRQQYEGMKTAQKAKIIFSDMGKGMWRQGKGFGMVGALYAGTECVVEGVRCLLFAFSVDDRSETDFGFLPLHYLCTPPTPQHPLQLLPTIPPALSRLVLHHRPFLHPLFPFLPFRLPAIRTPPCPLSRSFSSAPRTTSTTPSTPG